MSVKALNRFGDTIVEVLICMAIVSLALGGAYGIAVRSLVQVREAEERSQATRLAQQQVERLRLLKASAPKNVQVLVTSPSYSFRIDPDSTSSWGFKVVPVAGLGSCATTPSGTADAAMVVDHAIPDQYHVGAGFCLRGAGLGAGGNSQYDVVTFVVRVK